MVSYIEDLRYSATVEFEDISLSSLATFEEFFTDEESVDDISHSLINSAPAILSGVHVAPAIKEGVIFFEHFEGIEDFF